MRGLVSVFATLAVAFLANSGAQAALITKTLTGTVTPTPGSPADVVSGVVSGSVTYDPVFDLNIDPFTMFIPLDTPGASLTIDLPNGPQLVETDDLFFGLGAPTLRIDRVTMAFQGLDFSTFGVNAFGLVGLDFFTDFVGPTFFLADFLGGVVAEGVLDFGTDVTDPTPMPAPASLAIAVIGLFGLMAMHRRRASPMLDR